MRREGEITGGQRRRHSPEEAERAILAAARAFLEEHPFREMKVEDVMARTGLSRPAFYAYFEDRYELVTRLLEGFGGLLFAVDRRWLAGNPASGRDASAATLAEALRLGAETFERYGPVLRAISDAAGYDGRVEEVYRFGLISRLTSSVAARIARDVEAGISPASLVPEQAARALVLMTERYLIDGFGAPSGRPSPERALTVVATLQTVWVQTLYGQAGVQGSHKGGGS